MKTVMKKRRGFTLVELVAVVGIIAILSLIALPKFKDVNRMANKATFESNFSSIKTAITLHQAGNNGELPTTAQIAALMEGGITAIADLDGKPVGSTYGWDGTTLTCVLPSTSAPNDTAITKTFEP